MKAELSTYDGALGTSQGIPADPCSSFDAFVSGSSVGLGMVDRDFRLLSANPVLASVMGATGEAQLGRRVREIAPDLWSQIESACRHVIDHDEPVTHVEISGEVADEPHRTRHWWVNVHPVTSAGAVMGIGIVVIDITGRRELEIQLRDQALHDGLTGLANRTLLLERATQLMESAQSDPTPVSVLFMDLDDFKTVNDGLGHGAGDQLLVAVARRLTSALRSEETLCRFGDDEFVILATARAGLAATELAARVTEVMRAPFELDGLHISVTMSVGIASGVDMPAEELMRNAHIAMYKAKAGGKNATVTFTPPMDKSAFDRLHLAIDLRSAVERNEFAVLYQPMISLHGGAMAGVEGLVRWDHPTRGRLAPSEFLALAEDTGMMVNVGHLVLVDACAAVSRWQRSGMALSLAVNISPSQLESAHLVGNIGRILEETGIAPESLVLEVTESTVMRDVEVVIERLKLLKGLGVRLAIDDFGTGYSSLSYLRQFPIDILKIDQSFVVGIPDSAEQRAIVHALIELGQALELEIIAEGVESEAQLRFLREEGCDFVQGYFFARPLAHADLERFAMEWIP